MVSGVEALTGQKCLEAVPARTGPSTQLIVLPFVFGVAIASLVLDVPKILIWGTAAACLVGVLATVSQVWVIARTDGSVVVARSKQLYISVEEVVEEHTVPINATLDDRVLSSLVSLGGAEYEIGMAMRNRMRVILSSQPAASELRTTRGDDR